MSERNLYQRINDVRDAVPAISKDARIDGKYDAVTHDAVTRAIRPLMVEHGIASTISVLESTIVDTGNVWGKRKLMQYQARFECTLVNVDNPEETYSVTVEAHADDNGDKAPGKALSYAMKSFYLKAFAIETGENDEGRPADDQLSVSVETLSEDQLADLNAKAEELFGDEADSVLQSMAQNVFRVDTYIDIQSKHFKVALNKLDAKAKAGQ